MATKAKAKSFFDPSASLSSDMDDIAKRLSISEGSSDNGPPMSTGNLMLDLIMCGGIRPAWYTFAGQEQSTKTTSALTIMTSAIKHSMSGLRFFDYEGCVTRDTTYSNKGKQRTIDELFDLSNFNPKDNSDATWCNQYTTIDTISTTEPTGVTQRTCKLHYGGIKPITKITLSDNKTLRGYAHPIFVKVREGVIAKKYIEELLPGDVVLVKKTT